MTSQPQTSSAAQYCNGVPKSGKPCKAPPMKDSGYCYFHNPEIPKKEKLLSRSKGGKTERMTIIHDLNLPEMKTREDVVEVLNKTAIGLATGKIHPRVASSMTTVCAHILKAIESMENAPKESFTERLRNNLYD